MVDAGYRLRRDPRVIEALARRGITDMDRVLIDTWAYGAHLVPERHRGGRIGWADVWYRKQPGASPYERAWKVVNDNVTNGLGTPVGYKLVPGASFPPMLDPRRRSCGVPRRSATRCG